jgi:hypothetical protein
MVVDPACETDFMAPNCAIDRACFDECRARTAERSTCTPSEVTLFTGSATSEDDAKLVSTLEANLGALIDAAHLQGKVVLDAAKALVESGNLVLNSAENLDGHSLACAAAAAESVATFGARLEAVAETTSDLVGTVEADTR